MDTNGRIEEEKKQEIRGNVFTTASKYAMIVAPTGGSATEDLNIRLKYKSSVAEQVGNCGLQ